MLTGLVMGEPKRHKEVSQKRGMAEVMQSITGPLLEFFRRRGAFLVLLFILLHKIGDTLANLTFRLLFDDLGYTNDEIAIYAVVLVCWAYIIAIFTGGLLYSRLVLNRAVACGLLFLPV